MTLSLDREADVQATQLHVSWCNRYGDGGGNNNVPGAPVQVPTGLAGPLTLALASFSVHSLIDALNRY